MMTVSKLYLAPSDNPQLNQYFEETIANGLTEDSVTRLMGERDELYLWGLSEQKGKRYSHMESGDFFLFYTGDGTYEYAAKVQQMDQNPELLSSLKSTFESKGIDTKGIDRWQYVISFESPFPVNIDSREIHDYAGHTKDQPFSIIQMNKKGLKAIQEEFGGLKEYFETHRPETTNQDQSGERSPDTIDSPEEIVDLIEPETLSHASTINRDVSKLQDREIPLEIIYRVMQEKYVDENESSVMRLDAMGIVRTARLFEAGYTSIEEIAEASVTELAGIHEISRSTAKVITEHAQEILSDESIAQEIAAETNEDPENIEQTFSSVGNTGVARSDAKPIVTELHTRPSLIDIEGLRRYSAYHLYDHGYETPEDVAQADPNELIQVPQVGSGNVEKIQESAAEFAAELRTDAQSRSRLSNLSPEKKKQAAEILGIEDIESLDEQQWDTEISRLFEKLIESPFEIQLDNDN